MHGRIHRIRCTNHGTSTARHCGTKHRRSHRTTRSNTAGRTASVTLHNQPGDDSCICSCDVAVVTHTYIPCIASAIVAVLHQCMTTGQVLCEAEQPQAPRGWPSDVQLGRRYSAAYPHPWSHASVHSVTSYSSAPIDSRQTPRCRRMPRTQ